MIDVSTPMSTHQKVGARMAKQMKKRTESTPRGIEERDCEQHRGLGVEDKRRLNYLGKCRFNLDSN